MIFIVTIVSMPWITAQIPRDYFLPETRHRVKYNNLLVYVILMIIKNALGLVLLVLGFFMLFLPGPGIISTIVGITLLNFPGKYKLERWLIKQPGILKSINWFRDKYGKEPLQVVKD